MGLVNTRKVLADYEFEEVRGTTLIAREPIDVVSLITPWNWPLNQIACKVAPGGPRWPPTQWLPVALGGPPQWHPVAPPPSGPPVAPPPSGTQWPPTQWLLVALGGPRWHPAAPPRVAPSGPHPVALGGPRWRPLAAP